MYNYLKILSTLSILFFINGSAFCQTKEIKSIIMPSAEIRLKQNDKNKLFIELTLKNKSNQKQVIYSGSLCSGGFIQDDLFKITSNSLEQVRYMGYVLNTGGISVYTMKPYEVFKCTIELSRFYEMLIGTHEYEITYVTYKPMDSKNQLPDKIQSNTLKFTFHKE